MNPKPFVKWVGGKRSLLDELHKHLPESFNTYYEPFVGGGALFFSIYDKVKKAVLSDTNFELIITYKVIQKEPQKLIEALRKHSEKHSKEYYYKIRSTNPKTAINIASRFLYLNKTCFNGLYRVNKQGKFNSPIGDYKDPNIVQEENILACHEALQGVDIYNYTFEKIPLPSKGDFVYFDPPYHPTNEQSFTSYTENGFTEQDQIRLRDYLVTLHRKGVFLMMSNSDTNFVREIYNKKYFNIHEVKAPRFVNCKSDGRDSVTELLITNY